MPFVQQLTSLLFGLCCLACAAQANDTTNWPIVSHKPYAVIPDLSFLNEKPAGARGRVRARGPDLIFGDGSHARFWGANLQAYALFRTEPRHIRAQAKRLASLGFNLVRIHHHDSRWVRPNVFGDRPATTRKLSAASLKSLDLWIEALKAEGIYIWLDLHVGRELVASDQIAWFEEIAGQKEFADIRGFNFVSPSIKARMIEFQQDYLGHKNHVSGLRYRDDLAIIAVLISNENDLTHHFGNRLLPDKSVPFHNQIYMSEAETFAREHGLNRYLTWRSWEHGPSKLFLNNLEHRFYAAMTADLRQAGFDGLVATTSSWAQMPLASLPALSAGSLIDVHSYGSASELTKNPLTEHDMLSWIAAGQVANMPVSISEWNIGNFPESDRFILPPRMATLAAHQGWDAPMIYGYSQQPLNGPLQPSNWSVASDPAVLSMLPASALLYRQKHVRHARKTYAIRLSADRMFASEVSPRTSAAIRTLYEQSAIVVEIPKVAALPWLTPRKAPDPVIGIENPARSFLNEDASRVDADTGDFSRDFKAGTFSVNTKKTQLVAGAIGDTDVELDYISVRIDQPMAAVAVQSLDNAPINASEKLLITFTARMQPVDAKSPLFLTEPLTGVLRIDAAPGLTLRDLKGNPKPFTQIDGKYEIDLAMVSGQRWLELGK